MIRTQGILNASLIAACVRTGLQPEPVGPDASELSADMELKNHQEPRGRAGPNRTCEELHTGGSAAVRFGSVGGGSSTDALIIQV